MQKLSIIVLGMFFVTSAVAADAVPLKNWPVAFDSLLEERQVQTARPFRFETNAVPSAASHFIATTPCRVLDTRNSGSPLPANSTTAVDVVGSGCGIPAGAAAYSMNFTAMNPADNGFLTAYPTGSARPTTATLSYLLNGPAFDNAAIVPAGTAGAIDVYVAASLHLIIDINGYFAEGVVTNVTAGTGLTGGGTGDVTLSLAGGSNSYIQNTTTPQANANFNVSGNGTIAGSLRVGDASTTTSTSAIGRVTVGSMISGVSLGVPGIQIGNAGTSAILMGQDSQNYMRLFWSEFAGGYARLEARASKPLVLQEGSGNVGIGTNAPADRLHVLGDIRVGTGTTGCVKDADGTVVAGTCSSDARFKKNVSAFPSVLDKLARLRPVTFDWRAESFKEKSFGASRSFGLVAQEVEEVMPDLVTEDERGYKAVRYNKLPLLTLQAVKELADENDALRQKIDALTKLVCSQTTEAAICNSGIDAEANNPAAETSEFRTHDRRR